MNAALIAASARRAAAKYVPIRDHGNGGRLHSGTAFLLCQEHLPAANWSSHTLKSSASGLRLEH